MDELGYLKWELEMKKDRVREKDEAKTKVSDQGSKFNIQHCVYIGRSPLTHPLFQLDYVANTLSRQSAPVGSSRCCNADLHPRLAEDQLWQTLKVYLACSRLGEGHNSPFFVF